MQLKVQHSVSKAGWNNSLNFSLIFYSTHLIAIHTSETSKQCIVFGNVCMCVSMQELKKTTDQKLA